MENNEIENNNENSLPDWYLEERTKLDQAILDALSNDSKGVNLNVGSRKGFVKDGKQIVFSFNVTIQDKSVQEERDRLWRRYL